MIGEHPDSMNSAFAAMKLRLNLLHALWQSQFTFSCMPQLPTSARILHPIRITASAEHISSMCEVSLVS